MNYTGEGRRLHEKTSRQGGLRGWSVLSLKGRMQDSRTFQISVHPNLAVNSFQAWAPVVMATSSPAKERETKTERQTSRQSETERMDLASHPSPEHRTFFQGTSANFFLRLSLAEPDHARSRTSHWQDKWDYSQRPRDDPMNRS